MPILIVITTNHTRTGELEIIRVLRARIILGDPSQEAQLTPASNIIYTLFIIISRDVISRIIPYIRIAFLKRRKMRLQF